MYSGGITGIGDTIFLQQMTFKQKIVIM